MSELLVGCGSTRDKRFAVDGRADWSALTTLDINADHKPDVVHDLNVLPYPFADEKFDEIHAYEVLEHCGGQGNYRFFFGQFSEFWRMLKPGGHFCATVPSRSSRWALGDPSHTRVFCPEWLTFLQQAEYEAQVGRTPMSDFRSIYKADFSVEFSRDDGEVFAFGLKAIK